MKPKPSSQMHAILTSVLATCRQQAVPILEYLTKLQQFGEKPPSLMNYQQPAT